MCWPMDVCTSDIILWSFSLGGGLGFSGCCPGKQWWTSSSSPNSWETDTHMHTDSLHMHADANTHTQTQTQALTNPNQSLGNVLPAMQGNNMSFSTYKQTENSETTRQTNGHTTTSLLFLFHLERTFFWNATSRRTAARQLRAHDMKAEAVSGQILRKNTRDELLGFSLFLEWCLCKTASTLHLEKDTAETSVYGH